MYQVEDDQIEEKVVATLVSQAEANQANDQVGFTGIDSDSNESEGVERQPEATDQIDQNENMPSQMEHEQTSQQALKGYREDDLRMMIDQVVEQITPIIQACCITDRLEKAERNAEEWKTFANLLMKNPQFATRKLTMNIQEPKDAMNIGKHPMEQPWDVFIQTPLAAPIWTLIGKLDLHPNAAFFVRWWKKVKSDTRSDMWAKLSKYLQEREK